MQDFIELSDKPPITVISPETVTSDRFDSAFYLPRYLSDRKRLESLPHQIKDFRAICEILNCGATPKFVEYSGDGVPLIRGCNVRPNRFEHDNLQRVNELKISQDSTLAVIPEDILFTMSGVSLGDVATYPDGSELASLSNTVARARIKDRHSVDPKWVMLFLNSSLGRSQSNRLSSGGVLGHVMPNSVK